MRVNPRARRIPISFYWSNRFADMDELREKKHNAIVITMTMLKIIDMTDSTYSRVLFPSVIKFILYMVSYFNSFFISSTSAAYCYGPASPLILRISLWNWIFFIEVSPVYFAYMGYDINIEARFLYARSLKLNIGALVYKVVGRTL